MGIGKEKSNVLTVAAELFMLPTLRTDDKEQGREKKMGRGGRS